MVVLLVAALAVGPAKMHRLSFALPALAALAAGSQGVLLLLLATLSPYICGGAFRQLGLPQM